MFIVNADETAGQYDPIAASLNHGNGFVITWFDFAHGDILFRFIPPNFELTSDVHVVNENSLYE